ncbi:MAG TPA: FGGY family carbohydrate kinase [Propionibacteriaceae bacterium]|nr:FGGY family carbohydrate kinase [Propionibacteriaceae bacterium]
MITDGPLVIATDSSTTSTKAIVVDATGTVLAAGKAEIALHTPGIDRYEHDPVDWWRSTDEAVRQALSALDRSQKARITALSITPQRQSFALLDADGAALRPGILWLDGRAVAEVARLGSPELHALTGFQPDVTPSVYKLAWLSRNEPATLESAAHIVGVHAYLIHRLTGQWVDSQACADSLGLYDMARLDFDAALLARVGLRRDQLGELVAPGSVVAAVAPAVREAWGLVGQVDVIAGCGDGQAAALGCAALGPDEAYLNLGTAIVGGVHSATYSYGPTYRTDAAGLPGQYVLEIVQNSGAYLASWFRTELGDPALAGRPDPQLEAAAARVPAGCGGLVTLPYWNAVQSPHWDPTARGAIVGLAGAHGRAEIYRSILEGLAVETARNLAGLQADTGVPLTSIRVMGGGQRSPLWRQIMTDCIGLPLTACETEEVSALGAAVLAMAHATSSPIEETARAMARLGDVSEPDSTQRATYAELGTLQGMLYERLADVNAAQLAFAQRHPLA